MEQTQETDSQNFSRAIDLIASEYGWTLDQITGLTVAQFNTLIERIGERVSKREAQRAALMRAAIVASINEKGAEEFQNFLDEALSDNVESIILTPDNLSQYGMSVKKE